MKELDEFLQDLYEQLEEIHPDSEKRKELMKRLTALARGIQSVERRGQVWKRIIWMTRRHPVIMQAIIHIQSKSLAQHLQQLLDFLLSQPTPTAQNGLPLYDQTLQACLWVLGLLFRYSLPAVALMGIALICSYATTTGIELGLHNTYSWRLVLTGLNYTARILAEVALWMSLPMIVLALLRNLRPLGHLRRC